MNMNNKITFNQFCYEYLDMLFEPQLSEDEQCTGYKQLKKMILENIEPASLEEIKRWEETPTQEEMFSEPNIKYLRFLHPNLRPLIIKNWNEIKQLEL